MAGLITKCAAWKQLQHVLCLTELIDSNTTIDIWRIWERIRGLTGVHEKQSGIAEKQEIAVAAIRRQSTWGKFTESQPSPPLFSTQSLEGVVWISETQRKYSWLFPHIHKYRHNPGNPATYTKKKKSEIKREESAIQPQLFQTPRSGFTTSVTAQNWKTRIQQWTAGSSSSVLMGNQSSLLAAWRWQAVPYCTDSTSPVS